MSDSLFFVLAKIVWVVIRPESWIVLGLLAALVALWRQRIAVARRWILVTLGLVLALGILPLGHLAMRPLEAAYPADPPVAEVAGIVVLGGGEGGVVRGQPNLNEAGERFADALMLAHRHPEARIVFTGGSGRLRDLGAVIEPEASLAATFFARHGIEAARLTVETASRNTAENAALSLAVADPQPDETWLLVTSAFHMPRAMDSFARAGWTGLVAWPVDFRTGTIAGATGWAMPEKLDMLTTALKEQLGRLAYRVTGR